MKHHLALATIVALSACRRPAPPPAPEPVDAGADAHDQCVRQVERPADYVCLFDRDCASANDNECTVEVCSEVSGAACPESGCLDGRCIYASLPDGAGCDVSPMTDACQAGACCPRVEVFEGPR